MGAKFIIFASLSLLFLAGRSFAGALGTASTGHSNASRSNDRGAAPQQQQQQPQQQQMGAVNQMGGGGGAGAGGGGAGQGAAGGGGNKEGREESKKAGEKAREELNKMTEKATKDIQGLSDGFSKSLKDLTPKDNTAELLKQIQEASDKSKDSGEKKEEEGGSTTSSIIKEIEARTAIESERLQIKAQGFASQPVPQSGQSAPLQAVGEKLGGAGTTQRGDPLGSSMADASLPPLHSGGGAAGSAGTRAFSSDFATGSKVYNPPTQLPKIQ